MDTDSELLGLTLAEGEIEGETELDGDGLELGETLGLGEDEGLTLAEGETDSETELLGETLLLGDRLGDELLLGLTDAEGDTEGEGDEEGDTDALGDTLGDTDDEGLPAATLAWDRTSTRPAAVGLAALRVNEALGVLPPDSKI